MSKDKTAPKKLRGLELEQEVLKLRLAGASFALIARNLDRSVGGVHKACMRALERQIKEISEDADAVLALELQRLDSMLLGAWPKAVAGDLSAVDRVLRIMKRRARYLGLDAPVRRELSGPEGGPIEHINESELDREIRSLLREMAAREKGAAARSSADAAGEVGVDTAHADGQAEPVPGADR